MGNQSTSGIVEEVKATNEAHEKPQEVTPPDDLKKDSQTLIQEEEEHKGSVNEDCETQTIEPNEANLEEGRSMFSNEEQDPLCALQGATQNPNPECTSTITILTATPYEGSDNTSELQEDENMLEKEIVEIDVEKKENGLVVADTPSVEGAISETRADEGKDDHHPEEEQSNSFNTINDVQDISLLESSAAKNEEQNERFALCDIDHTSYVDQNQLPDQEINRFLMISCSDAPPEMIKSDIKENGEECEVEIESHSGLEKAEHLDEVKKVDERDEIILSEELKDPDEVKEIGLIQMEGSIAVTNNQESDELGDESILETVVLREAEMTNNQEDDELGDKNTLENAVLREDEVTSVENGHEKSEIRTIVEESKSKAQESTDFGSNELRKSPSFDFGLSFDRRSEESDQTPLLYLDKTPRRSFSSCSNVRFQNRSIQTDYLAKYEAVVVEEKTIRMERSNSESLMAPPLNLMNKEGKVETLSCDNKKQEKGLNASQPREEGATISPRANAKRKTRSSLFTTCICCSAAIS